MTAIREISLNRFHSIGPESVLQRRAKALVAGSAAALVSWLVAVPVAGSSLVVGSGAEARTVGPGSVLLVSILAGLGGVALAAALPLVSKHPRRTWLIVAVTTLVLSMAGPLGAATGAAGAALATMHVVVGAILVVGIGGTIPQYRGRATGTEASARSADVLGD